MRRKVGEEACRRGVDLLGIGERAGQHRTINVQGKIAADRADLRNIRRAIDAEGLEGPIRQGKLRQIRRKPGVEARKIIGSSRDMALEGGRGASLDLPVDGDMRADEIAGREFDCVPRRPQRGDRARNIADRLAAQDQRAGGEIEPERQTEKRKFRRRREIGEGGEKPLRRRG